VVLFEIDAAAISLVFDDAKAADLATASNRGWLATAVADQIASDPAKTVQAFSTLLTGYPQFQVREQGWLLPASSLGERGGNPDVENTAQPAFRRRPTSW
jgi:hypothetical protein